MISRIFVVLAIVSHAIFAVIVLIYGGVYGIFARSKKFKATMRLFLYELIFYPVVFWIAIPSTIDLSLSVCETLQVMTLHYSYNHIIIILMILL